MQGNNSSSQRSQNPAIGDKPKGPPDYNRPFHSERAFGYSFLYFPPSLGKTISPKELSETTEIITFVEGKIKTKVNRANQTIDVGLADKGGGKSLYQTQNAALDHREGLLCQERVSNVC